MTADIKETNTNMVLGVVINYFLTIVMFSTSAEFALGTSAIFMAVSWIRTYAIRKYFRNKQNKEN